MFIQNTYYYTRLLRKMSIKWFHKGTLRREEAYRFTYQIEITIRPKIYPHLPTTKTDINPIPRPHYNLSKLPPIEIQYTDPSTYYFNPREKKISLIRIYTHTSKSRIQKKKKESI